MLRMLYLHFINIYKFLTNMYIFIHLFAFLHDPSVRYSIFITSPYLPKTPSLIRIYCIRLGAGTQEESGVLCL